MALSKPDGQTVKAATTIVGSPKRGSVERAGLHAWLPYYAGYSEAFVEGMLGRFGLGKGQIVIDPMNGSGTTSCVAQRLGISVVGVELNPAARLIAKAKNGALARPDDVESLVRSIRSLRLRDLPPAEVSVGGQHWVSERAFRYLRAVWSASIAHKVKTIPVYPELSAIATHSSEPPLSIAAVVEATLLRFIRRLCPPKTSKNPSWVKRYLRTRRIVAAPLNEWSTLALESANDLATYFGDAPARSRFLCLAGDARNLPLPDRCADAVITSPPYLTRIDYAVGTGVELAFLGYDTDPALRLRELRRAMMGTPCVRHSTQGDLHALPVCSELVRSIREHGSYAAEGYYAKIAEQYFADAVHIVQEIARILRPGAKGALVIQDSWFKNVHLPLAKAYVELAERAGLSARIERSEPVTRHMGQLNSAARKYRKGEVCEHVVVVEKPTRVRRSATSRARLVGR